MKKFIGIFSGALCLLVVIFSPFLIKKAQASNENESIILTVWHIDGFEGGKGSRYTFLREMALNFSKKNKGVYILVSNYTQSGANELISKGKTPDVISYGGVGIDLQNYAQELSVEGFEGGVINGKCYAVSYLKGGYFAIKKGDGSSEIIISKGENVTPEIACLFSSERASVYTVKPPLDAYALFLTKKNATLIGTQRDIERLISRGEEFSAQPINGYSDIYQYLSLTSQKAQNEYYARKFISHLTSKSVQEKVTSLKMLSVNQTGLYPDNEYLSALEKTEVNYTFSPFSDRITHKKACDTALSLLKSSGNYNEIINFIKQL